ncbi:MAG: hypothetical protein M3066_11345 [Actinomycetota bacterium]|nr:hypothetical protein [Actinomycetota bacterium]
MDRVATGDTAGGRHHVHRRLRRPAAGDDERAGSTRDSNRVASDDVRSVAAVAALPRLVSTSWWRAPPPSVPGVTGESMADRLPNGPTSTAPAAATVSADPCAVTPTSKGSSPAAGSGARGMLKVTRASASPPASTVIPSGAR